MSDTTSLICRNVVKSNDSFADPTPNYNTTPPEQTEIIPATPTSFPAPFFNTYLPSSMYILYCLLTAMQELPMTSIAYLLNKEAKLTPAELMTYYNLVFFPWTIKPLYGLISDNIPIFGYRRKPYLIFFSVLCAITFVLMPIYGVKNKIIQQILGIVQSLCICFCEVQVDGLVVALTNNLAAEQEELFEKYPYFKEDYDEADKKLPTHQNQLLSRKKRNDTTKSIDFKKELDYSSILAAHPELYTELTHDQYKLLTTPGLKGSIQSEAMTCRSAASFGAAALSMLFHVFMRPDHVITVSALLPLVIVFCIGMIPEHSSNTFVTVTKTETVSNEFGEEREQTKTVVEKLSLGRYIIQRIAALFKAIMILWKPLLFVLLLRSMPTATDPLMSYIFGELDLPPWILSGYSLISVAAGFTATLIYWKYFTRCSVILSFLVATILAAVFSLPTACLTAQCNTKWLHIPDYVYVIITTVISAVMSRFSLMPFLTLCVDLYPAHNKELKLEATMFTTYTAMNNIGALLSYSTSMVLLKHFDITYENFKHLPDMVIVCALCSLIPLLALPLVSCTQRELAKEKQALKEQEEREAIAGQEGATLEVDLFPEKDDGIDCSETDHKNINCSLMGAL